MAKMKDKRQAVTLADVMGRLGGIPLHRVRAVPPIGTATEEDLLAARDPAAKLLELIDGTLVEKAVTFAGSVLGGYASYKLANHVEESDAGVIVGAACPFLLKPGLVRIPNVAFIPWERIPGGAIDMDDPFARYAPVFIVELIAPESTSAEMDRKLRDFFTAGTRLAWVIDPATRSARCYSSSHSYQDIDEGGILDGGAVLPGFSLLLPDLFASLRPRKKPG